MPVPSGLLQLVRRVNIDEDESNLVSGSDLSKLPDGRDGHGDEVCKATKIGTINAKEDRRVTVQIQRAKGVP